MKIFMADLLPFSLEVKLSLYEQRLCPQKGFENSKSFKIKVCY